MAEHLNNFPQHADFSITVKIHVCWNSLLLFRHVIREDTILQIGSHPVLFLCYLTTHVLVQVLFVIGAWKTGMFVYDRMLPHVQNVATRSECCHTFYMLKCMMYFK